MAVKKRKWDTAVLEQVDGFEYLGSIIDELVTCNSEILARHMGTEVAEDTSMARRIVHQWILDPEANNIDKLQAFEMPCSKSAWNITEPARSAQTKSR